MRSTRHGGKRPLRPALLLTAGLLIVVAALVAAVYFWSPRANLRVTTGPPGSTAYRFITAFASVTEANHPRIHIKPAFTGGRARRRRGAWYCRIRDLREPHTAIRICTKAYELTTRISTISVMSATRSSARRTARSTTRFLSVRSARNHRTAGLHHRERRRVLFSSWP